MAKPILAYDATVVCEVHNTHPLADSTGFYRVTGPDLLKIGLLGGHGFLVIPFAWGLRCCARTGQA